jgi:hypothetical protein
MQALTATLYPCYAAADREIATAIARFLEQGADVRVLLEEGEMRPGEELAQKARDGRMADIVLVLFSRHSLPSPWPRSQWEAALQKEPAEENVRIGFVKCDGSVPPRVLAPQFELAGLPLSGLRRLKRWVRAGTFTAPETGEDVEALGIAIADQPGTATVEEPALAAEFARVFREDFDEILRLECGGRSLAALAGDLAAQLGIHLAGETASNLARLRDFCSARRFLLLLEGASAEAVVPLVPGGRCSTLISIGDLPDTPARDESLRAIQYTFLHGGLARRWPDLCRLARQGLRITGDEGRLAERFELLQQWHTLAEARSDRRILEESTREMVWMLQGWDRVEEARSLEYRRATEYDQQMALPFGPSLE